MNLTAIALGYAVPRTRFDADIHSVFRSAANFRPSGGTRLLTLTASGEADLPQGIRVATPTGFSFEELAVGQTVTCRAGLLRFANTAWTIDLNPAQRWKCDLPTLQADLADPTVAAAWQSVWQTLNERQIRLGAEIVADHLFRSADRLPAGVPRQAGKALCRLIDATRRLDETAVSVAGALMGLGAGLTPSGDDLLVGYLAGLWCATRAGSEYLDFTSQLGKTVIRLSPRTNDISRTYLYHAARGQVSSRLAALAEAICQGRRSARLLDIAEAALCVGHTSGLDAVTGLLMGLAVWNKGGQSTGLTFSRPV